MWHSLQTTFFPDPDMPEALYLRASHAGYAHPVHVVRPAPPETGKGPSAAGTGQGAAAPYIQLRQGTVLSTNTFFGAFYFAYWQHHAPLDDIAVTIDMAGAAQLRVFEETDEATLLLREDVVRASGRAPYLLHFAPTGARGGAFAAPGASRLFVEITALGPCRIRTIDFVTSTPPRRRATLSVGICTFNQESYLTRTLQRLVALSEADPRIAHIHVVNQGAPIRSPALRALLERPKVVATRQRNLGGSGGFARTLDTALAAEPLASHHLVMDDDVVLDARMIPRALRFVDYTASDVAIGAGMLDAMAPTIMYEAGAFLRNDNRTRAYCQNVDMAVPAALAHFDRPVATDYNAWWFCLLPLAPCRAIDLPAPIFIRGDDFEYGQRLAEHGVATVTLPGIAVWHAPFYATPSGWQEYYSLRNRLIFAGTYSHRVRQLPPAHVASLIMAAALTHDYGVAELRLQAVEDFLKGPEALFATDIEDQHAHVLSILGTAAGERLDDAAWRARSVTRGGTKRMKSRLLRPWPRAALRTLLGPLSRRAEPILKSEDVCPEMTAGRAYVVTNAVRSYHYRHTPDRCRLFSLLMRAAPLIRRYRRHRARAGRAWKDGIGAYRRPGWWAGAFAAKGRNL